jgi:AcrR family transcriptional regulator
VSVSPSDRLLQVVVDLLVSDGFEGVSVRKVATAADVSIGAVQHHFRTKDAMLQAAMDLASRQFQERLSRQIPADTSPEAALRVVTRELLGLGDEARAASVLWVLRLARAAVDPPTAAQHAREWQDIESLLLALVVAARPDHSEAWASDHAGSLLALVDGLATSALVEPGRMPPDRARRLLEQALDRVLD